MLSYKCKICPATSWSQRHMAEHEARPHLVCSECGARRVGLRQHARWEHAGEEAKRARTAAIRAGMLRRGLIRG